MNAGAQPKISVIMGIYNCEETLAESIESILSQSYKNWELIMCDDASTDGTYQIARRYADHYSDRITLIQNKTNQRLAASLNRCLTYATGIISPGRTVMTSPTRGDWKTGRFLKQARPLSSRRHGHARI